MGGLTSLLLLLCVGVTVSSVLDLQKRIIGGTNCPGNQRKNHVAFVHPDGHLLCGGSLLKNDWVLTAAHCWMWGMKVHVGVHPLPQRLPAPVVIKAPPVMYGDNNNVIHDLMLLKLPQGANSAHITPVDLPANCANKPTKGATVQMAGYAATTKGPNNERGCDVATTLQCANIKITECTDLMITMITDELRLADHWLCGDTSNTQTGLMDACPGDSGGGVMVGNTIYGVISFTGNAVHAHASDVGFMDVCEYKDWIEKTVK